MSLYTPDPIKLAGGLNNYQYGDYRIGEKPYPIALKIQLDYRTTKKVDVLKTRAKPINDTWSITDPNYPPQPTKGGGKQVYTGKDISPFKKVTIPDTE